MTENERELDTLIEMALEKYDEQGEVGQLMYDIVNIAKDFGYISKNVKNKLHREPIGEIK